MKAASQALRNAADLLTPGNGYRIRLPVFRRKIVDRSHFQAVVSREYQSAIPALDQEKSRLEAELDEKMEALRSFLATIRHPCPNGIAVNLVIYGPGGSYNPATSSIDARYDHPFRHSSFENFVHETVHLIIEGPVIEAQLKQWCRSALKQQSPTSSDNQIEMAVGMVTQRLKERMVDEICLRSGKLMPRYEIQKHVVDEKLPDGWEDWVFA
jgi:hypothetical protein